MSISWSEPVITPYGAGGSISVKEALGDVPSDRFFLYQTPKIPTMWVLYDQVTKTQWFRYGEGWEGAQKSSEKCIAEILSGT